MPTRLIGALERTNQKIPIGSSLPDDKKMARMIYFFDVHTHLKSNLISAKPEHLSCHARPSIERMEEVWN